MNDPLDELYLTWLYSHIADVEVPNPSRTYWTLAKQLYTTEFIWFVPNDDNRVEDGKDMRYEFAAELGLLDVDPDWLELGCSMLEMLISLSRRLSFQDEGEPREWFWHLLRNVGLYGINDRSHYFPDQVGEVLNTIIFRTYKPDGSDGGLFPLRHPTEDQRDVELWYQLSAYLLER